MNETKQDTRNRTRAQGAEMRQEGMPTGQAPAVRGAKPPTAAEQAAHRRREARDNVYEAVRHSQPAIEPFLRALGISWEFFLAAAATGMDNALTQDEDCFLKASPESFIREVTKAAKDGLLPDGKEAAIVRYKDQFSYNPMVKGLVKIMWETGLIGAINHNIVLEGDTFEYEEGSDPFIRHRVDLLGNPNDNSAPPLAAYCVLSMRDSAIPMVEITRRAELLKIASMSRAERGPRASWAGQMHRKAPLRRIIGRMPPHPRLAQVLEHDTEATQRPPEDPGNLDERRSRAAASLSNDALLEDEPIVLEGAEPELPIDPPEVLKAIADFEAVQTKADYEAVVETIREGAVFADMTDDQVQRLQDAGKAARARLVKRVEDAPQVTLRALLSSQMKQPRIYRDPALWVDDILKKMSTLKADALRAFWSRNQEFVLEGRAVAAKEAERILGVAKNHAVYSPTGAGRGE